MALNIILGLLIAVSAINVFLIRDLYRDRAAMGAQVESARRSLNRILNLTQEGNP